MHAEVKQYADEGNVKGLKYIFLDALDVDPTFEKYMEDFNYCKNKNLFEHHRELSTKKTNSADWNTDYWIALKMDLKENFSEERIQHMREVAKVIYADKIARQKETPPAPKAPKPEPVVNAKPTPTNVGAGERKLKPSEQEAMKLEEAKRRLAEENRKIEAEQNNQKQIINENVRRTSPKKASGTLPIAAIAGVAIFALILLIILLK